MSPLKRQNFRFFHRLRVRWAEVDMQKIVFNAHYQKYFDTAMADLCVRRSGHPNVNRRCLRMHAPPDRTTTPRKPAHVRSRKIPRGPSPCV